MPYIRQSERLHLKDQVFALLDALKRDDGKVKPGELNYAISKMIVTLWNENTSYTYGNELIGVLECVKQEFYRKQLSKYEDLKESENGTV